MAKKVINRKVYDTATAKLIHEYWNGSSPRDFHHLSEDLYRTPKGSFFLLGSGGAMSKYSVDCGNNSSGGSSVTILYRWTKYEVIDWLEAPRRQRADSSNYFRMKWRRHNMAITEKEIIDTWFPNGLPTGDEKVLMAWAGISLKLATIPFELINMKREITPILIERIQATMKFLGIGWAELEEGACLAINEGVNSLREQVPDVPDERIS
ncbi:MAG TPA: hypothetical protein DCK76_11985 [Desulfotomaculum sp.]|nr:hypothetical protein [Desulfotomaculum sp.]